MRHAAIRFGHIEIEPRVWIDEIDAGQLAGQSNGLTKVECARAMVGLEWKRKRGKSNRQCKGTRHGCSPGGNDSTLDRAASEPLAWTSRQSSSAENAPACRRMFGPGWLPRFGFSGYRACDANVPDYRWGHPSPQQLFGSGHNHGHVCNRSDD